MRRRHEGRGTPSQESTQERVVRVHVGLSDHGFVSKVGGKRQGVERRRREDRETHWEEWTQWVQQRQRGGENRHNNINFQSLDWVFATSLSTTLMTAHVLVGRDIIRYYEYFKIIRS